jgi:hypothetical protein
MSEILEAWPALPLEAWQDTYATLHMWTQIVGKIRKTLTPLINHWWNVTLYLTARGLTTSPIPYGTRTFEIQFDFIDHKLTIQTSDGLTKQMELRPRSVADFYKELTDSLAAMLIEVRIHGTPDEVPNPIPFAEDETHKSYDPQFAHTFWRILATVDTVFKEFRAGFIGKCSPVQFFWGSFDLAVTRFSGRRAPERPSADAVTREAYSHEVISAGFWPGGGEVKGPAFYTYAAPEPAGFKSARVLPETAFYHSGMSEYFLMYDDVRRASAPKAVLLDFLHSTYAAAADLGKWDRAALERSPSNG